MFTTATLLAAAPVALAQQRPGQAGGVYVGGYSGGNSRGGSTGVYVGGYPGGLDRGNGSGYYVGGYPSSFSGDRYPSNPPGYIPPTGNRGSTSPLILDYPDQGSPGNGTAAQSSKPRARRVQIEVQLPPTAELWFDDQKTKQTGAYREFVTPPLPWGKKYTYTLRARWRSNGQPVEESRNLTFSGGQAVDVHFGTSKQ